MKIIEEVEAIMEKHGKRCPFCDGTGKIEASELMKVFWPYPSDPPLVNCRQCFGTGVKP